MGCCSSVEDTPTEGIMDAFIIADRFNGIIWKHGIYYEFKESDAIIEKQPMSTFLTDEETKQPGNKANVITSCEKIVKNNITNAVLEFYRTNKNPKYRSLTIEQKMNVSGELARNFVAHVIGDEIKFSDFNTEFVMLVREPFSNERIAAFADKVLTVSGEKLDPSSNDCVIIKAINLRLCLKIIQKIPTFKTAEILEQIFEKLYSDLEKKKNEVGNKRVRQLAGL